MSTFYSLKVQNIIRETADSVSIVLDLPLEIKSNFAFKAGQYLTFKKNIDGEEIRRSYSISSAPFENVLQVSVKKVQNGLFSTYANNTLKIGDILEVMTPEGNFCPMLIPENHKNYVFFAAGSGITPILSIIKSILAVEKNSSVTLIYGNKTHDSIMFREVLEDLKNVYIDRFSLYHILSREVLGNELLKGRIDEAKCAQFSKKIIDISLVDAFYICGPYEMILSVKSYLSSHGVDANKIHFELFTAPTEKEQKNENQIKSDAELTNKSFDSTDVEIIMDGDSMKFAMPLSTKSMLDYAYQLGYDLPYSCKGGVCCTCKAKVLEGKVTMNVNYSLEEDEVKSGYVLMCQAKPDSEKVVISFDE